ncbi:hypothetical protein LJY25_11975 [Hymenobacter sp. BT175]|uniref:hypothetical protein n=1 Tax=Hymenobacter translucens TaxID=2886507 RepID=UPI001D0DE8DD|nr:hypothetical protein [Hymenobacter translucens]MCC2547167.1 hypothetical protein [Hymenobacter translucens]
MKRFTSWGLAAALPLLALLTMGCEKEVDDYFTLQGEPGQAILGLPNAALATKYAPGETIPILVAYAEAEQLRDVTVFQATKQDSSVTGTFPAAGAYNTTYRQQVMQVPYTVPTTAAYPNGTLVRVDVTLNFQNGSSRTRRFSYSVANAPTLKFGTTPATYRNGLSATAQMAGDLIGYSIILNENGVSTFPPPTATPTFQLFKAVDSLTYFSRVGTANPVRIGSVRNPTAGATNARTIDLRIPTTATVGQQVTFLFTAYAQAQSTTLTTAPITVANATPFSTTTRSGRITFGPGSTPDSTAFNLRTGLNEPAANAVTAKDLLFAGVSGSTVSITAPNTTRFYKIPGGNLATFTGATANSIGLLLFQNTTTADLGTAVAVGDVYAVRVRGTAEVMVLRITGIKPSTAGSIARVKFDYRTL